MITFPTDKLQKVVLGGACKQNGTPTPDNPMDIICNNGVIKVSPNLFDKTAVITGKIINGNGVEESNSGINISDYISVIPGQTYIRSLNAVAYGNVYFTYDKNKTFIATYQPGNGIPFTIASGVSYIRVNIRNENLDRYQLEQGSTATPYRPYGQIYTEGTQEIITDNLGNTANAEMLLAVNDYKDTQEVLSGSVTRNVGIKVLDGTENWESTSTAGLWLLRNVMATVLPNTCICTHFLGISTTTLGLNMPDLSIRYGFTGYDSRLYIRYNSLTNTNELKQYLADQYNAGTPVIVVYPLTEPTIEQVTPQPLTGNTATITAGSIDNLPIESSTIAELKKRYIGNKEVKRVYIGDNLVWKNN